jgi:hypothetical protein
MECNRVGYNMIIIRTLSLLVYFTYIFIDIIIYALESTPWSIAIFRTMGRVITDPSLDLFESMRVVPRVPIHIKLASTSCSISGAIGVCTITRTHGKS